ncbi:MAG: hypothetical protein V3S69_02335, partial [Dehalococcoidales bacterium]
MTDTDLREILVAFPGVRRITATKDQLRATLLASDGQMLLQGSLWKIKSKPIGAGIYEVWLEA